MKGAPEIREMAVADLVGADWNPRRIAPEALRGLAAWMERFGLVQPLVWSRRSERLVAGHQRLRVMRERRIDRALVVVVDLPAEEEKALAVALNSPHLAGEFTDDLDLLLAEIRAVDAALFEDLRLEELAGVAASDEAADPDAAPTRPSVAQSEPGCVWLCGDHRVACGDATDAADVRRCLDGREADLVFTDPPYNMDYRSKGLGGILNDRIDEATFIRLILASTQRFLAALRPGGSYYVCMGAMEVAAVIHQLRKLGESPRTIVWAKDRAGLGAQEYRPRHEMLLFGSKPPRSSRVWNGGRRESDLWEFSPDGGFVAREEDGRTIIEVGIGHETVALVLEGRVAGRVFRFDGSADDVWRFRRDSGYVHPTQKPVALVERAVRNSSGAKQIVFDPFGGSGTTLIAAHRTGRVCCTMDLDPRYVDVIVRRWCRLTGGEAVLDRGGAVFRVEEAAAPDGAA